MPCTPLGDPGQAKDWFVLDLDSAGKPAWCVTIGGPGDDEAYAVATSPQRIFVGGRCGNVTHVTPPPIAPIPKACVIELTADGASNNQAAWFGTDSGVSAVRGLAVLQDTTIIAVGHHDVEMPSFAFDSYGIDWEGCMDGVAPGDPASAQPFVVSAQIDRGGCRVSLLDTSANSAYPVAIAGSNPDDLFVAGQFDGSLGGMVTSVGNDGFAARLHLQAAGTYLLQEAARIGGGSADYGTAIGVLGDSVAVGANLLGPPGAPSCPNRTGGERSAAVLAVYDAPGFSCRGGVELASQSPPVRATPPRVHDLAWAREGLVVVGDFTELVTMFGPMPMGSLTTPRGYVMFLDYDPSTMLVTTAAPTLFFGSAGTDTRVTTVARNGTAVAFGGEYTGDSPAGNGELCPGLVCGFIRFAE